VSDAQTAKLKGWRLLAAALRTRKSAAMLAFGFSSGLPFALLVGTLNAWLGEAKINLATIGVLSWIGLAYAFKFLWSPLVDRVRLPGTTRMGRRRPWILACQLVLAGVLVALAGTDPATNIGQFAVWAVLGALASATQDIAIDAWRIDVADDQTPVELLASINQFGYRTAAIVGGAFALFLAYRMSWPSVYLVMAGLLTLTIIGTLFAPSAIRAENAEAVLAGPEPRLRALALAVVGAGWLWALLTIGRFMVSALAARPAGQSPPSVADFTRGTAPWIVVATILMPLAVAAAVNRAPSARSSGVASGAADHLYRALITPLADLAGRLGWGVLVVVGLILTYALCYNVWATFAYPFYLDYLHYTKDEVAFASKIFGIFMTMLGIGLGGFLFVRLGRFPTVLLGAILPIAGNFLYADLAEGGANIDLVSHALRLDALAVSLGSDERMVRLLLAISGENVSTGLALTALTAYVSGIVSKRFAAVQYALLSSLTFLIGSLGRGLTGAALDSYGYAPVFRWVAIAGAPAIGFVLLEWWRSNRASGRAEPGHTGEPG